eukprot:CAMPEP_0205999342 /NCGR_PEP_ID=MMETSP1464-20131121/797_1 /ASSEMBLY_ACC=CAM_ASM_001124 /TAXON_ID=119497 /ORGANISM="Exanthemachrysis gayraliae, Strain RCC1523" /LENGTH=148 /DNA_ID=CAMNT_0053372539 /DNA_START=215 /DNA_END=657 /DNA_ORIENTATION=-
MRPAARPSQARRSTAAPRGGLPSSRPWLWARPQAPPACLRSASCAPSQAMALGSVPGGNSPAVLQRTTPKTAPSSAAAQSAQMASTARDGSAPARSARPVTYASCEGARATTEGAQRAPGSGAAVTGGADPEAMQYMTQQRSVFPRSG